MRVEVSKGLLEDVAGVFGVSEHLTAELEETDLVAVVEARKGVPIARSDLEHQLLVRRLRHHRKLYRSRDGFAKRILWHTLAQ